MIIKIQDKEYNLKYDINALAKIEEETGQPISNILNNEEISVTKLRTLFKCGLKGINITDDEAGDLMESYGDLESLGETIVKAFEDSSVLKKK